jgi:hypothetical protein
MDDLSEEELDLLHEEQEQSEWEQSLKEHPDDPQ